MKESTGTRNMLGQNTAKAFWMKQEDYPHFDFVKKRRLYELNYLLPRLKGNTLLDIGCGDGALLDCLLHLTDLKLYGYDISESLLKNVNPKIQTKVYDCCNPTPLVATDITVLGAVLMYIFEDTKVDKLLSMIHSDMLFIREPCSLTNDEITCGHSEKLKEEYAARYRTVPHIMELLGKHFVVEGCCRIYPDEIESDFGTKQFYFQCVKKEHVLEKEIDAMADM